MTLSTTQSCAAPVEDHPLAPATADQQLHLDNNNKPRPLESHVESDSDILPHGPTQAHRSGARICRMVSRRRISFKRSGRGAQQLKVKEKVEDRAKWKKVIATLMNESIRPELGPGLIGGKRSAVLEEFNQSRWVTGWSQQHRSDAARIKSGMKGGGGAECTKYAATLRVQRPTNATV